MSDRARSSLHQRGIDTRDLAALLGFVADYGGEVRIRSDIDGYPSLDSHVTVRIGGHTHGGYVHRGALDYRSRLTRVVGDLVVRVWDDVLADADTRATEAQVDEVLA